MASKVFAKTPVQQKKDIPVGMKVFYKFRGAQKFYFVGDRKMLDSHLGVESTAKNFHVDGTLVDMVVPRDSAELARVEALEAIWWTEFDENDRDADLTNTSHDGQPDVGDRRIE